MKGSFICDKNTFKYIYKLEKSRSKKSSYRSYLSEIKFDCTRGIKTAQESQILFKLLAKKLRAGDVVCRWNQNQYLVILFNINEDNTDKVMKRIFNNFLQKESDSALDLEVDYQSLN